MQDIWRGVKYAFVRCLLKICNKINEKACQGRYFYLFFDNFE